MTSKPTHAVILLNLGGPETIKDVQPFLYRLFQDPEIIRIPFLPLRYFVAWMISISRIKKSKRLYASIGGGSPIRKLTDDQSRKLEEALKSPSLVVRTAFAASPPLIENVIRDLALIGIRNFLAFPLYPQYSYTTTKTSLARTKAAVNKFAPGSKYNEILSWPDHPLFLEAHGEMIREEAKKFTNPQDEKIHLLFSAHSIPEKLVTKLGDPYKLEIEKTVNGVLKRIDWKGDWTLAWQSKLGPVKWLEPPTEQAIEDLAEKGIEQLLVVPIAFVTDHIETLNEIDIQFREEALEAGIKEFRRTLGLNSRPTFIKALADIVNAQKEFLN
jgi:ferrochelatase